MKHCTEDDLVLHYYGEETDLAIDQHLAECAKCTETYQAIVETLQLVVSPDVPARDEAYSAAVWQRVYARISEPPPPRWWQLLWRQPVFGWRPIAVAAALATVAIAALLIWRTGPGAATPAAGMAVSIDAAAGERVRLAAIGDHLERSERMLLDLVNANADGDRVDLSAQQSWAAELIDSNRLYREAATQADDALVGGVLDDLERGLLDIVHSPSTPTAAELDGVRMQLDVAALLFKVRVLADELHEREIGPIQARKTT